MDREALNEPRSQDGGSGEEGSSVFLHDAKTASDSRNNVELARRSASLCCDRSLGFRVDDVNRLTVRGFCCVHDAFG